MSRAARVTAGLRTDRVMSRAACVTAGLRTDRGDESGPRV